MSANFIATLDAAEKKADVIIDEAKKQRKNLLTKARDAAAEELKVFSAAQDSQYKAVVAGSQDDDATKELQVATAAELAAVESDFIKNKDKTVGYVVEKVLEVPLALTSTQRQALISDSGRPAPVPVKAAPKPVQAAPKPVKPAPAPVVATPPPQPKPAPVKAPEPAPVPEPAPKEEPAPEEPAPVVSPRVEEPPAEEPPAAVEEAPAAAAEPPAAKQPKAKKESKKKKNANADA